MANPNIYSGTSIIGNTAFTNAGTGLATLLSGEANKVHKIGSIIVSNYGTYDQNVTVLVLRATVSYYIASQVTIPAKATVLLLGREHSFYLLEDDALRVNASAATSISVTVSYETLS
jgi:hypothetical protein